jgi:hypothetical protein
MCMQVGKGDQSVAVYAAWLDSPDGQDASSSDGVNVKSSVALQALAEYNRDDCESTRGLADWLSPAISHHVLSACIRPLPYIGESTRELADWLWELRCATCPRLPTQLPAQTEAEHTEADQAASTGTAEAAGVAGVAEVAEVAEVDASEAEEMEISRLEAALLDESRWSSRSALSANLP